MKKLALLLGLALASNLLGQSPNNTTASHIRYGSALPSACRTATGDVFFKTTATIQPYYCSAANTWTAMGGGGGGGGADTNLGNLSSVAINTSLLPAGAGIDLGSTSKQFRNLLIYGSGTAGTTYLEITGTPTGTRVITIPDATDTLVNLATIQTLSNKTFVGPVLGVATGTSFNGLTITTSTGTLTIANGVTLTGPSSSATVATIGLTNTFTGRQDSTGAASTGAFKTGTSLPGTCTVGDLYFKSDATAGQNIYECQSTNTWTQQLNNGTGSPCTTTALSIQFNSAGSFGCVAGFTVSGSGQIITGGASSIFDQSASGAKIAVPSTFCGTGLTCTTSSNNTVVSTNSAALTGAVLLAGNNLITAASGANLCTPTSTTECLRLAGGITPSAPTAGAVTIDGSNSFLWFATHWMKLTNACAADCTMTMPTANTTIVGTDTTNTLTNKTIAGGSNTISALTGSMMTNNTVTSTQMAVVNTRRVCDIGIGDTSGSTLTNSQLGPQKRGCFIPAASTVVEIDVSADAGTPSVIVGRNVAGTQANLLTALSTASSGGIACSNTGGTTGIDGATTCTNTLTNTAIAAGAYLELVSGTASTAKWMTVHIIYTIN